jgi:hypothetical protein
MPGQLMAIYGLSSASNQKHRKAIESRENININEINVA